MKLLLSTFCVMFAICSNACLNFFLVDEKGHGHNMEGEVSIDIHADADIAKRLQTRYQDWLDASATEKFTALNDYAAMLIKAGCSEDAVPILRKMLIERTGVYQVHANLAVAYEILGQLDSALIHLKKSLQLNPSSHENSEWFHQQILEYAIAQKGEGNNFSSGAILRFPQKSAENISYDISYQLHERVPLTGAPNELLSRAIEESADFLRKNLSLEWALSYYAVSIAYASDQQRKQRLQEQIEPQMNMLFKIHQRNKIPTENFSKKTWKRQFKDIVDKWSAYRPYYYDGPLRQVDY